VDRPQMARSACGAGNLRYAIEHGELINHYQPPVSLRDGEWWASKPWCAGAIPTAGFGVSRPVIGVAGEPMAY